MLKRVLYDIGLVVIALILLATRTSPWFDVGVGLLILGCVLTLFTIRDAIVSVLQRLGMPPDRDRALVHLAAAIMAMCAATTFFDNNQRIHGIRWFLMVALPLAPYLLASLWGAVTRCLFGRNDAA